MWGLHLFWPFHWLGWGFLGIIGLLFRLVLLGGVVALVVVLARRAAQRRDSVPREDSALETLRRRYASGEISKEEYEQKMKDLG